MELSITDFATHALRGRDFKCSTCQQPTTRIHRHHNSSYKYLATFFCENSHCTSKVSWEKCRVCTDDLIILPNRIWTHFQRKSHKEAIALFEADKTSTYLQQENLFVEKPKTSTPEETPIENPFTSSDYCGLLSDATNQEDNTGIQICDNDVGVDGREVPRTVREWLVQCRNQEA